MDLFVKRISVRLCERFILFGSFLLTAFTATGSATSSSAQIEPSSGRVESGASRASISAETLRYADFRPIWVNPSFYRYMGGAFR
jgi:hypothetical protein